MLWNVHEKRVVLIITYVTAAVNGQFLTSLSLSFHFSDIKTQKTITVLLLSIRICPFVSVYILAPSEYPATAETFNLLISLSVFHLLQ